MWSWELNGVKWSVGVEVWVAGGRGRVKLKAGVRVWFCRSDLGVWWSGGGGAVGFYEVERDVSECKKRVC